MDMPLGAAAVSDRPKATALQLLVAVPPGSLDEFTESKASQRLAVLEADKELVNRLMWRQYVGPEWRRFAEALAQYGFQVLRAWVYSGVIFTMCKQKGMGGLLPAPRNGDDSEELAGETVSEAICAFRTNVLVPGRWDPTRGASLKTFFVGQCLFQFPNVYRRWLRESQPMAVNRELLARELANMRTHPAPVHVVAELIRTLERLKDDSPQVIEGLLEMGFSQQEIGELLGTTRRALEAKLYRYRKKQP